MKYREKSIEIIRDFAASNWLKSAIIANDERDIIDVLNEIETLQELYMLKFEEMKQAWEAAKAKECA